MVWGVRPSPPICTSSVSGMLTTHLFREVGGLRILSHVHRNGPRGARLVRTNLGRAVLLDVDAGKPTMEEGALLDSWMHVRFSVPCAGFRS